MKRTSLRPRSAKRAAREAEAAPFRHDLILEVGECERCGHRHLSHLACHEIANGYGPRQKALDVRAAVLVLCDYCHKKIHAKGLSGKLESLALLWLSRPQDFDLSTVWKLRGDKWPELEAVINEASNILKGRGQEPR